MLRLFFFYVMEGISMSAKGFLVQTIIAKMRQKAADNVRFTLVGKRYNIAMIQFGRQRFCDLVMMDVRTQQPSQGNSDVVITEGNVVDAIIETAAQYDGDTIVMGPTRWSALGKAVLGSVVRGGLTRTERMVVITPPVGRGH